MMVARWAGSGNLQASPMAAAGVSAGQRAGFVHIGLGAGSNSGALSGIEITGRNENNVTKLLRYQNERRRGGDGAVTLKSFDVRQVLLDLYFLGQENGRLVFSAISGTSPVGFRSSASAHRNVISVFICPVMLSPSASGTNLSESWIFVFMVFVHRGLMWLLD